jgi:hypothetical protein
MPGTIFGFWILSTNAGSHSSGTNQRGFRLLQARNRFMAQSQKEQVLALATDFPLLWHDSETPNRERKRMVRPLIEDVTGAVQLRPFRSGGKKV